MAVSRHNEEAGAGTVASRLNLTARGSRMSELIETESSRLANSAPHKTRATRKDAGKPRSVKYIAGGKPSSFNISVMENGYRLTASFPTGEKNDYGTMLTKEREWIAYDGKDLDAILADLKAGREPGLDGKGPL